MKKKEIENDDLNYTIEEIENLPPEDKKEYYRLIIQDVLRNNPDGLTVSKIQKITGFNKKTIRLHLDYLTAIREAYKKEFGPKSIVYYPNHNFSHPHGDRTYKIGDAYYTFKEITNEYGEYLYIQEKTKDRHNMYTVLGGIIISKDGLEDFIRHLEDIKNR